MTQHTAPKAVAPTEQLSAKDFATDQEVRWCPGCGDYAILKAVQKTLADLEVKPEDTVFVSGIGCAARFPYYMETYGFHTLHGRAPSFATGIKLTNPELDVWVVSGDGDSLSIGGNHLMHLLRRNTNVQYLLFNNEIYGLTKGQYSPTSRVGTLSPSTPRGSVEQPVSAALLALGAGGRFIARSIDNLQKHLTPVLKRAHQHTGTSFVEIFQNCIVFNDGAFSGFTAREAAANNQIHLEHGKPMRFGKDGTRGLRIKPGSLELEAVTVGGGGFSEADLLIHDETNRTIANLLSAMEPPHMPIALGVIYCDPKDSHEQALADQGGLANQPGNINDLGTLLRSGQTWTVS